MARIFITGAAGFIGFHLSRHLLAAGHEVHGFDNLNAYYDVSLKEARLAQLSGRAGFQITRASLEDESALTEAVEAARPNIIVHLAAQAGVRYSLENPRAYIDSNVVGAFNVMEAARRVNAGHLMMASTSSVYGSNAQMPFHETHKADAPMTIYAATKKAAEAMAHSYAHLYEIPTTMFRFFTVYGPWGRPDMAYFKFVRLIREGKPIDVYNHGEMHRDFTYVDDLVRGIALLMDVPPTRPTGPVAEGDSLSPVAPYRIVNIGNSKAVRLLDFIEALEAALGQSATRNYMDMQPGDVPATWADATLLEDLTGYRPQTDVQTGTRRFVEWYLDYYGV